MLITNKNNGTPNKVYFCKRKVKTNKLMNKDDKKQNSMDKVFKRQQAVMEMGESI